MKKSNRSIPSYLNDFLDWLEIQKGLSSKSQENYARFLKRFLDWLEKNKLSNLKPHELSSDHVWNYRVFLSRQCVNHSGQPLKKTTQNYYLIALRSLLNYFADKDILSLPTEKIQLARDKGDKQVRFLVLEQLEKLFKAPDVSKIQGLRDRAILEILFSTGMRISELTALDRNQIKIKPNSKEELELSIIGKGNRMRTVYFSERALHWLSKYLETRKDDDKALFINYRSKKNASRRLTNRSIEKSMKKYVVMAGLPLNTTPHVMRHSFSTDLLAQGVDIRILQEFLGHKNIAATQIYAHVTNKKLREIHQKFHGGGR
ncbi:MAG: tyrosine-type recombinase/integrase [Candidatus Paceibacterota bacterium]|jgi:site-specific recombinase XerD